MGVVAPYRKSSHSVYQLHYHFVFSTKYRKPALRGTIGEQVRGLIDLLPPEQKQVLVMRHFGEMSFKEIAAATGVSINTALGRMRYALINLRKLIREKRLVLE